MGLRYVWWRLAAGLAVLLWASPMLAQRIEPVEGVFYYEPAAYGLGAEALWNNPAGLGKNQASGFQLMADIYDDSFARSWGLVSYRQKYAMAYRYLDRPEGNYREYTFGFGAPLGQTSSYLGASYRYYKGAPGIYDKMHTWTMGLLIQGRGKLSWGAVFSNLNRSRVDGERSEIEQRYSLAYRPWNDRVTVAVDMSLSTKTRLSNAEYVYHVEVVPKPGVFASAFIDSHRNFEIGVRMNLLRYFVGTRSGFNRDGDHRRTTAYVGATDQRQPSVLKSGSRRLAVSLSGRAGENPPQPVFGHKATPFVTLITQIYRAAEDASIGEMLLDLKGFAPGFGRAQELREAIGFFRGKGKRVICYLNTPGNLGYYIGSACDSILIPPVCQLNLVGLRAELTFYAGTFEKIGIKADMVRIGDYKTAPERYTHSAASEENREQVNNLLDNLYEQFVSDIGQGRGLTADSVKRLIDRGPFTSAEALDLGLVDGLCYRDEIHGKYTGRMPEVSFRRYRTDTLTNDYWGKRPVVAVVVAEGEVGFSAQGTRPWTEESSATPSRMKAAFAHATRDSDVRAIVFRVNSPGGFALAGEDIYHAAEKAARKKPMVVSMSNIAASGGYYIAMPASHVMANRATVTGSIGIYGGKPDLSGLYERLSLGKELYVRGKYAGMLSWSRPFTDDEREKYYSHLKAMYDRFVSLVAANRSLPEDSIDALGRGRVWTGWEARANGLVDELGGIHEAIAHAADLAGLEDYDVRVYPENRPWFILPKIPILSAVASIFSGEKKPESAAADLTGVSEDGQFFTRLPYDIIIE